MLTIEAFERLERLAKDLTGELVYEFGTTPQKTCEIIADNAPDLWAAFGPKFVLGLVEKIQYSELPAESARLQETFRTLNRKYFDGKIPGYVICAVYDVNYWEGSKSTEPCSGFIDFDRRLITIGYSGQGLGPSYLLHFMIHAANPEWPKMDCQHQEFLAEEKRLRALGAPVDPINPIPGSF
jgi:hypothetical protein